MDEIKPEILADSSETTINSQQIETLKKHFPQCFDKDGNFIAEKLNEIVAESGTALSKESYGLNWLGKSYARLLANENPLTLLAEDKKHNKKPENQNSENLLIKGDNLEVLKHLKGAYSESIEMIYIDPPYNTGSDGFVYQDDRKFTPEQLAELAGIETEEAKRILEFTQSKANSHSAWLTFMYPRLYIARELLKDDGKIFISIDDNESDQLKLLINEVFGEQNFIAKLPVIMNLKGNQDNFGFADTHEYCYVFAKNKDMCTFNSFDIDQEELLKDWLEDEHGLFKEADNLRATGINSPREKRPNLWYPIFLNENLDFYTTQNDFPQNEGDIAVYPKNPDGEELSWYWEKNKVNNEKHNLIHKLTKNGHQFYKKQRPKLGELPTKKPKTIWYKSDYSTSTATTQLKNLLGNKLFEGPKPVPFIKDLLVIGSDKNSIVMDFFAGSGTTAHAVMNLNREDDGNRKFICIQLPEKTEKSKAAYKAGYKTIFDITKARIEKAAEKIRAENPDYNGDLGFQIFETLPIFEGYLDNIETLQGDIQDLFDGATLSDEQLEHLLTTWKVYDGIPLTQPLVGTDLAGYTAFRHEKVLYLMHQGFKTESLKEFLSKLDTTTGTDKDFGVEKIVLFGYNFDSKNQLEINEAVRQYQNRKEKNVSVVVRY